MKPRNLTAWIVSILVHVSVLVTVGAMTLAGGRPAKPGVSEIAINLSAPPAPKAAAPAPQPKAQPAPQPKPKPKPKAKPKPKPKPIAPPRTANAERFTPIELMANRIAATATTTFIILSASTCRAGDTLCIRLTFDSDARTSQPVKGIKIKMATSPLRSVRTVT